MALLPAGSPVSVTDYRRMLMELPVGWLLHTGGKIVDANQTVLDLLGQETPNALEGTALGRLTPQDRPMGPLWMRHADGHRLWLDVTASPTEVDGLPAVQVLCWDVTDRLQEEQRLTHAALHDGLTGLPNRVLLEQHWARLLTEWPEGEEGPAALFCDLDGFKQINDSHGHAVGDEALRTIAARLRGAVRGGDVVGRYGGDEFAVLMRAGHSDAPDALVERIRDAIREPLAVGPLHLRTAISVGRGSAVQNPEPLAAVLARADEDMYRTRRRDRLA